MRGCVLNQGLWMEVRGALRERLGVRVACPDVDVFAPYKGMTGVSWWMLLVRNVGRLAELCC